MLENKKILIGITGSIAAYKAATLVRLLVKAGATVKVVMTPSAKDFISPLTLSTLSKNPVLHSLSENDSWANHVMLGRWADLMLIAPLSCNTLAKMANGLCDNLLMAVYLSATCKVLVAPAMDEDMWLHPSTKANIQKIRSYGNEVIPVNNGELASGLKGEGRMAEPEEIIKLLRKKFSEGKQFANKKVLITAGPTYEPIDPVRFIGNFSSGKMGVALAEAFRDRGAEVTLIMGPGSANAPAGVNTVHVKTAQEMYDASLKVFSETDVAVLSAAVADYRPVEMAAEKIKKSSDNLSIELTKTPDILKALGSQKKNGQIVIGFALETFDEEANAIKKLEAKNADFIVLNSLRDEGAGFGTDTNKIVIFDRMGGRFTFETKSKKDVAADIINTIASHAKI